MELDVSKCMHLLIRRIDKEIIYKYLSFDDEFDSHALLFLDYFKLGSEESISRSDTMNRI